jgi:hypothetical protein
MCRKAVKCSKKLYRSKQWCWESGVCGSVGAGASSVITYFVCLWTPCAVANLVPSASFYTVLLHYVCRGRGGLRPHSQCSVIFNALQLTNSIWSATQKLRNYAPNYPSLQSVEPHCTSEVGYEQTSFPLLHACFWVIPRRLNFICRRFGTLCLFHLRRPVKM